MPTGPPAPSLDSVLRRWDVSVALLGALVVGSMLVPPIAPRTTLPWDLLMMAGLVTTAGLFALPVISPRSWSHFGGPLDLVPAVRTAHRWLGYAVLAGTLVHALGLLILEPLLLEYLKLSAPWGMLAALAATVLMAVLIVHSEVRRRCHRSYDGWWRWHAGMSLAVLLLTLGHIVDAGYYANTRPKFALLVWLGVLPSIYLLGVSRAATARARHAGLAGPRRRTAARAAVMRREYRLAVLAGLLWLAVTVLYFAPAAAG